MTTRPRFGLIARLALLVVAIEVAAFSALGWFYIARFGAAAEQRMRDRLLLVSRMLARNELAVGNLSNADLIAGLVGAPYLDGVVVGGNGRVIAARDPTYLGHRAETVPGLRAEWFNAGDPADSHVQGQDGRLTAVSHARAEAGGPPIYSAVLTVGTHVLEAQKRTIALWGWVMSGLFVLVGSGGIILVAQRLISRRIDRSLAVLRQVQDGRLDARIAVDIEDELGQLQSGVNAMTGSLAELLQRHRRNEEEIAAVLDAIADGVIAVGPDGEVLRCNPSAAVILGGAPPRPGTALSQLLPEVAPGQPRWWCASDSVTARGRIHFDRTTADGQTRSIELGHGPILSAEGDIVGAVLVLQDVTQRRRSERELREAVERLTVSNSELERFAYVASHDLQEPLRTITSFTQLLERSLGGRLEREDRESFAFVVGAAKRMSMLINDLLAFSRVNSRGIAFAPVSLQKVCAAALDNLRDSITASGADIQVSPLPEVLGDGVQLMQVFQNLIGNSIKFRRPDAAPRIAVSALRDGGEWRITVTDNGIGVVESNQDIFEIFRRLHTAAAYPGSGVGLAICKRIVLRHNGRIWYDSTPGQGAAFHFTLPAG